MTSDRGFESRQSSPEVVGAPSRLSDEELSRSTLALHDGMHALGSTYNKHVLLAFEDPVTFGAGHYVFCPLEGAQVAVWPSAVHGHRLARR